MNGERGAIAGVALAVLGVLSILTGAWLRLVADERETVRLDGANAMARSMAQAGIERTLAWFADPASFAEPHAIEQETACRPAENSGAVFSKRCFSVDGLPSYRASDGALQFGGTADHPAVRIPFVDAEEWLSWPASAPMDPRTPPPSARIEVRLFAPLNPDGVATVVSRAEVGRTIAVVRAELMEGPWQGLTQAVFVGDVGSNTVPVRAHWGGIAISGGWDASSVLERIPRRSETVPVGGSDYIVELASDRWIAIRASGPISGPPLDGSSFATPFDHLSQYAVVPRVGLWRYQALKTFARRNGRYFTTRGTGLLYADDTGPGLSPTAVFASYPDDRRLLFIDTLDRKPPGENNLETLHVVMDAVSVDAYVGAHVSIKPGSGMSVVLDSPSAPATPEGSPVARNVTIDGVHYRGLLVVEGSLAAEARTKIVGALVAQRGVRDAGAFEVWYDAGLRNGYRKGFPPVVIKPGTRRVTWTDL